MTTTENIISQIVQQGYAVQIWEHVNREHTCFAIVQQGGQIEIDGGAIVSREAMRHVGFTVPKATAAPESFGIETATATVRGLIDAELTLAAEKLGIKLSL